MGNHVMGETLAGQAPVFGRWIKEIYRWPDGAPEPVLTEREIVKNLIVNNGMDFLAGRIGSYGGTQASAMVATAVGTVSTAATLTNASVTGEVSRKAFASSSLNGNIFSIVNTWGGGADSVASVQLAEAGVYNMTTSGQGTLFQRVVFASVVLANSDFLRLTIETTVGSR